MGIEIVGEFPGTPSADLALVLRHVQTMVARRLWPRDEMRPIGIEYTPDVPRIWADADAVLIQLTAQDRHWPKFALQAGYFFCAMALTLFDRHGANKWYLAACAEAAAMRVLRDMSEQYGAVEPYAKRFALFADALSQAAPLVPDLAAWTALHEPEFRELDGYDRVLAPVANAIADTLKGEEDWRILSAIPDSDEDIDVWLPIWSKCAAAIPPRPSSTQVLAGRIVAAAASYVDRATSKFAKRMDEAEHRLGRHKDHLHGLEQRAKKLEGKDTR